MYYLQSRYYNSKVGRFINEDRLTVTNQGFLGNNMFAYCLNNPVCNIDRNGDVSIWYYVMLLSDWGLIHRLVQADIMEKYGTQMGLETELYLDSGKSRVDIICPADARIWEVKYDDHSIAAAEKQLCRYRQDTYEGKTVHPGEAGVFKNTFYISIFDSEYEVTYKTPLPGIVIYNVHEVNRKSYAYSVVPALEPEKEQKLREKINPTFVAFAPIGVVGYLGGNVGGFAGSFGGDNILFNMNK